MSELAHAIWAGVVLVVSVLGFRALLAWLNHRAARVARDDERAERERGWAAKVDSFEAELKGLRSEVKTFLATQRAR